jgi:hypothetical protein
VLEHHGKRRVTIVSAVTRAGGGPDFAVTRVEVTPQEFDSGIHYYLAEADLLEAGYEEPFVHFDDTESPRFLLPAVQEYLGARTPERNQYPAH